MIQERLFLPHNQVTDSVKDRLMEHIDQQAMLADEVQHGDLFVKIFIELLFFDETPQKVAEEEQKHPRQDGEVVHRVVVIGQEADDGEPLILIQRRGQVDQGIGEQPDMAVRDAVAQHEQQEENDHPDDWL